MEDALRFVARHKGIFGGILFVGVLLILILVPLSFQYVELNEMGFKKNTATNDVDRGTVYTTGRYHFGLGHTIVEYPTTFQKVSMVGTDRLSVFADGGLTLFLEVEFYYKIPKESLAEIYENYVLNYHNPIVTIARGELRNAASQFPVQQYLENRTNVTDALFVKLKSQLRTKALVDLSRTHFFLQRVYLPSRILDQKTTIFTTNEQQIKNNYTLQSTTIRLETTKATTELNNKAALIQENATASSSRLISDANSRSFQRIETERGAQVRYIIDTLGLTTTNSTTQLLTLMSMLDKNRAAGSDDGDKPTLLSGINGAILQSP